MKVRRVVLDVEVPFECTATAVRVLASGALNHAGIQNQWRVVEDRVSANTELPTIVPDEDTVVHKLSSNWFEG